MYYFYDATYILVIIGAIISLIASMNVKSTFNRYDKYNSRSGLTGAMAAQEILRAAGITNVRIERVSGNLQTIIHQRKEFLDYQILYTIQHQ